MKDCLGGIRDARHILDNQRQEHEGVDEPRERRHEHSPNLPELGMRI